MKKRVQRFVNLWFCCRPHAPTAADVLCLRLCLHPTLPWLPSQDDWHSIDPGFVGDEVRACKDLDCGSGVRLFTPSP